MPWGGRSVLLLALAGWGDEWIFWLVGRRRFGHARRLSMVEGYAVCVAGAFYVISGELM